MRLRSIALFAATLGLAATCLSGCLAASTAGSAVAGAAMGATSAVVKTTVHMGRSAVNAVTPSSDKGEAH